MIESRLGYMSIVLFLKNSYFLLKTVIKKKKKVIVFNFSLNPGVSGLM